jgi:hypothetical protein
VGRDHARRRPSSSRDSSRRAPVAPWPAPGSDQLAVPWCLPSSFAGGRAAGSSPSARTRSSSSPPMPGAGAASALGAPCSDLDERCPWPTPARWRSGRSPEIVGNPDSGLPALADRAAAVAGFRCLAWPAALASVHV